ncbi:hypothetical protein CR513_19287, partial [Mucuna pruriens]
MIITSPQTKKEKKFQDLYGMRNKKQEVEYEKFPSCKSSKEMGDTLPLTYEDHKTKVTTLRASKDLKKLPMEELIGMLKVHEIELNEDEGQRKGKSTTLKA